MSAQKSKIERQSSLIYVSFYLLISIMVYPIKETTCSTAKLHVFIDHREEKPHEVMRLKKFESHNDFNVVVTAA